MAKFDFIERAVEDLERSRKEIELAENVAMTALESRDSAQQELDMREFDLSQATSSVEFAKSEVEQRKKFFRTQLISSYGSVGEGGVIGENVAPYTERLFRLEGVPIEEAEKKASLLGSMATVKDKAVPAIFSEGLHKAVISFSEGSDFVVGHTESDYLSIFAGRRNRFYRNYSGEGWRTGRSSLDKFEFYAKVGNLVVDDDPEKVDIVSNDEKYILVGHAAVEFAIDEISFGDRVQANILKQILLKKGTPEIELDSIGIYESYAAKLEKAIIDGSGFSPIELHSAVASSIPEVNTLQLKAVRKVIQDGHIGTALSSDVNALARLVNFRDHNSDMIEGLIKETVFSLVQNASIGDIKDPGLDHATRVTVIDDAIRLISENPDISNRKKRKSINKLRHLR